MTIFYITNLRFPTEKAHGWQIAQMCQAFVRLGHNVTLVVPNRQTHIKESAATYYGLDATFPVTRLPMFDALALSWLPRRLAFLLGEWSFCRAVSRWAKTVSLRDALVITRDHFLVTTLAKAGAAQLVFEAHDTPRGFAKRWQRIAKYLRLFVSTTAWQRDEIVREWRLPADRVAVLPNAVDVKPFLALPSKEEARRILGLPEKERLVVYTGHLYAWKGVHTLAEASALLPRETRVVVVGGTREDQSEFKDFIATHHLDRVTLVPHVARDVARLYMAAADCLVLPNSGKDWNSVHTTSPIKLVEYLAAARPVVASDLPSIREVVSDTEVFFVKPDDAEALAEGIKKAFAGDENRVVRGKKIAEKRSWEARAEALLHAVAA